MPRSGYPLRARFAFALETGLRPATIDALEVGRHWSPGERVLRLTADVDKARFARPVPLSARAVALLESRRPRRPMTTEKWTPKVGDVVAIVYRQHPPTRGEVTRALKRYVEVATRTNAARRFRLDGTEVGSDYYSAARIEPWTPAHDEADRRAAAIGRLRKAADAAFATGEGRARIEALPTARLDEAATFLRALVEEANRGR